MSIFKKFSKSDISITPFTAHKQSTFTSSSLSSKGGKYYSSSFPTVSYKNGTGFEWARSSSINDPNNHKKYFQLDHLFYKDSKLNYANKFNTIEYFDHYRVLHDKVNIISLPYKTIGYKIHSGSFLFTTGSTTLKDDNKGHIYDAKFNLGDTNFKNEDFRKFYIGPERGHEAYDLSIKNGKFLVNAYSIYSDDSTHYNDYYKTKDKVTLTYSNNSVLDDSFLCNYLDYKNVTFSPKNIGGGDFPVINFKGSVYENNLRPLKLEYFPKYGDHSNKAANGVYMAPTDIGGVDDTNGNDSLRENAIDYNIGPFGETELTWECWPTKSNGDGGFLSEWVPIDSESAYMFTCYIKRIDFHSASYTHGNLYWGLSAITGENDSDGTRITSRLPYVYYPNNNTTDMSLKLSSSQWTNNPYFQSGDVSLGEKSTSHTLVGKSGSLDKWLLFVGYVYPSSSASIGQSGADIVNNPDLKPSKIYDVETGITGSANGTNNIYFWGSGSYYTRYRAYHYYQHEVTASGGILPQGGNTKTQEFSRPAIFKMDGTEPTIGELLNRQKQSGISSPHNSYYDFNKEDDFAVSFYISSSRLGKFKFKNDSGEVQSYPDLSNASSSLAHQTDGANYGFDDPFKRYLISKSTTKTVIKTSNESVALSTTSSNQLEHVLAEPQYPFEIYIQSQSLFFNRFDGDVLSSVSTIVTSSTPNMVHIICQKTGSNLEIYQDGIKIATAPDNTTQCQNKANLYIGSKGADNNSYSAYEGNYFQGAMAQIMIFDDALSQTQINNLSQSIDNKPYIGNIFYNNGLAAITKPNYQDILNPGKGTQEFTLKYQGTHLIYENEYQCMVDQHEYDYTLNPSARKIKNDLCEEFADFVTGSNFRPYTTTIGLYNDANELLAVGKLGQAIRMNDETDMTFVVRFDT